MTPCLFCKIAAGTLPAKIVHEDDRSVAFADINPKAPVHVLVIPKRPLTRLSASSDGDAALLGHLLIVARKVAEQEGVATTGYRVVTNDGAHGGQSVDHLHLHVLGGRQLTWPPG